MPIQLKFLSTVSILSLQILSACTYAPENASTHQGNSGAISVTVSGAYTKPNIPIQVQGYNMSTGNWVNLGNAVSSSSPTIDNDKGTLYTWTVSVTPSSALWPNDGLVQLRAKATDGGKNYFPVTFDDFSCVVDELNDGKNYTEAGAACASYNTPNLTLVDVGNVVVVALSSPCGLR